MLPRKIKYNDDFRESVIRTPNEIIDYLYRNQLIPGGNIMINKTPAGIILNTVSEPSTPASSPAGSATGYDRDFTIIIEAENPDEPISETNPEKIKIVHLNFYRTGSQIRGKFIAGHTDALNYYFDDPETPTIAAGVIEMGVLDLPSTALRHRIYLVGKMVDDKLKFSFLSTTEILGPDWEDGDGVYWQIGYVTNRREIYQIWTKDQICFSQRFISYLFIF